MKHSNPESWHRIEGILERALELAPEARADFLDQACAGNEGLRGQVEKLLAADAEAEVREFMEASARDYAATLVREITKDPASSEADAFEGKRLGAYEIVRQIGRGGMGAVFLAERVDGQFDQQVALKIVKRGLDTGEVLERFLQERQILARFEHPNIARLLDGGVTEDGVPYFAMEYVEGTKITTYCDERQLEINNRLQLFRDVCRAVHYAHRNLIVHRDLKPSNILVDTDGQVKLLDFGIAKLLAPQLAGRSATLTQAGDRIMTPAYAAPEQVRSEPVTTATDVYALGVTLYELLTGHRPLHLETHSQVEIERMIIEETPQRPSIALRRVDETPVSDGTAEKITPESVGRARNTPVDRLCRHLAGDLDNIALKALRKEPERRYPSAEALSEDIRRYLSGWPIAARKDTVGYRFRKFVLRNRVAVVGAGVVMLSLLLGLAATAWQAQVASKEARKAAEVKEFLIRLLALSDPDESKGKTVTAREFFDRGVERIERELSDQPEVKEEVTSLLASVYQKLGLYVRAQRLAEQALFMRRDLYGQEHPKVAESLSDLALALHYKGEYDEAEQLFREALEMRRRLFGERHPDVAESLHNLALLWEEKGDYDTAQTLFQQALEMRRTLLGNDHPDVSASLSDLASLLSEKGQYDAAEPLFREALSTRRRMLGDEHREVASDLNNLAVLLKNKGDYSEAEALFREALVRYENWLGEEHRHVTITKHNLATVLHGKGDHDQAERLYRQVLERYRTLHGEENPDAAYIYFSLATLAEDKADYASAVGLYEETLEMSLELLGEQHRLVAATRNRLGIALLELGSPEDAGLHLRKALATYRNLYSEGDRRTARALAELGRSLVEQNKLEEAEPLLRQALGSHRENFGDSDQRTAQVKVLLGLCLMGTGDFADAERYLTEARPVLTKELAGHQMSRRAQEALAQLQARRTRSLATAP